MSEFEFYIDNKIVKMNLNKINVFFVPSNSLKRELIETITNSINGKLPAQYNFLDVTKNTFSLISLAEGADLDSDLKLTSKSKMMGCVKEALSKIPFEDKSAILETINNNVQKFFEIMKTHLPLDIGEIDYPSIQEEDIIKAYFKPFNSVENIEDISDQLLYQLYLNSVFKKNFKKIMIVEDFPKKISVLDCIENIKLSKKKDISLILFTSDINMAQMIINIEEVDFKFYCINGIFDLKHMILEFHLSEKDEYEKMLFQLHSYNISGIVLNSLLLNSIEDINRYLFFLKTYHLITDDIEKEVIFLAERVLGYREMA